MIEISKMEVKQKPQILITLFTDIMTKHGFRMQDCPDRQYISTGEQISTQLWSENVISH